MDREKTTSAGQGSKMLRIENTLIKHKTDQAVSAQCGKVTGLKHELFLSPETRSELFSCLRRNYRCWKIGGRQKCWRYSFCFIPLLVDSVPCPKPLHICVHIQPREVKWKTKSFKLLSCKFLYTWHSEQTLRVQRHSYSPYVTRKNC